MRVKLWILAFVLAGPAFAVSPDRVGDPPATAAALGSDPRGFVSLGGRALFFSDTGFWASDGSAAGTVKLTDERLDRFLAVGTDFAYLVADSPSPDQYRLWVTDGTPGGTFPLVGTDLPFSIHLGSPAFLLPGTKRLFFVADDDQHGAELWTSDGSPEGTRIVADLLPGDEGSNPFAFTSFRHRIFFVAEGPLGRSLWSMDEAGARVRLVKDPEPLTRQLASPYFLTVVGRDLFFFYTSTGGTFLWKSDGTGPGTVPLAKLLPATLPAVGVLSRVAQLDRLFFVLLEGGRYRLWTSNGTPAGTRRLALAGQAQASATFPPQIPGKPLLFAAAEPVHGFELWVSNGTQAGTRLLKDVFPGSGSGYTSFNPVFFGDHVFFIGKTPARGEEVWITDATEEGTRLVQDICPGRCDSRATSFASAGGKLYFFARDNAHGVQLWRTDGTAAGTLRLSDFPPFPFDEVLSGAAAGSVLLFRGYDLTHGLELWRSRGTPPTTRFLAETRLDGSLR